MNIQPLRPRPIISPNTSFQETHLKPQPQFCEHPRPDKYKGITEETDIKAVLLQIHSPGRLCTGTQWQEIFPPETRLAGA